MDRGDELEERMTAATEPQARLTVLTRAVATRVARAPAPEPAVRAAARALREPRTRITGLPERLGLSERHLRRRFEVGVGNSPTLSPGYFASSAFSRSPGTETSPGWRPTPVTATRRTSRTTAAG